MQKKTTLCQRLKNEVKKINKNELSFRAKKIY